MPDFVIEQRDPATLAAHPRNWRTHPERQKTALRESLTEHGWLAAPIYNQRTGRLLDGHARVEDARERGEATIPVRVIDVPERQEKRILASFDRIAELRERDDEALGNLLAELAADGGLPAGWEPVDLEALIGPQSGLLPGADPDALPDAVETRCQPGGLWQLGNHRLLCGDSTKREDVERLMDGRRMVLLFTSPPYLQQRDYGQPIDDWDALMQGVFACVPTDTGQILVNLGLVHREGEWLPYWDGWIEWMRQQGWRRFGFYVWDQGHGLAGDWKGRLAPAHEFIFHFNRETQRPRKTKATKHAGELYHGTGMREPDGSMRGWSHAGGSVQPRKIPDSVFRVTRHMARGIECQTHAPMAVALAVEVTDTFSKAGDGVYEPFAGSGTQIIAAEQLGRACYAMEISPQFCDVALARWEAATGQEAQRL